MNAASLLAAVAVLLGFAAARELLAGGRREDDSLRGFGMRGRSATAVLKLGLPRASLVPDSSRACRCLRFWWPSYAARRRGESPP